jgi:GxxExxY protein
VADLLHQELTGQIIRVYYDIYNGLSRTYPEFIYENAMMAELIGRQIKCTRQEQYQIFYKEWLVGAQRLDIFVAGEIVVELKATLQLTRLNQAQTMSYLKTTGQQVGLLFNFGSDTPQFKRVFRDFKLNHPSPSRNYMARSFVSRGFLYNYWGTV